MYGVPSDLPLRRFVGDAVFQICIGRDGVHFVFGRAGTIAVEGRWELIDSRGAVVDRHHEHDQRDAYRVHMILNEDVTGFDIDAPRSFSLVFASGHRLVVYDDAGYESFHIYPDGIHV